MTKLKSYRLKTSQEKEIPPYCVFTNKTLDDLIEKHPTILDELKSIVGLGKHKITLYGEDIIDICKTTERTTLYEFLNIELSSSKKQISSNITLELFLKGNTLEDICNIRNIKENTIIDHIINCIPHEGITYNKFMTENEYLLIKNQFDLLSLTCKLRDIKDNLPEEISYNKMRIVRQLLSN